MHYEVQIRLSWVLPPKSKIINGIEIYADWFDCRFITPTFPSKSLILEKVKEGSEEAYEKLNSVMYLLNMNESKMKLIYSGSDFMSIKPNFEDSHISYIWITRVNET